MASKYKSDNITSPDLVREMWRLVHDYHEEFERVKKYESAQDEYENLISINNPSKPITKTRVNKVMRDLGRFHQGILSLNNTYQITFAMKYLQLKYCRSPLPNDLICELDNMGAETNNHTQTIIRNINDKVSHLLELLAEKDESN